MVSGKITAIRSIGLLVMALVILSGASNATAQKREVSGAVILDGRVCPASLGNDCVGYPSEPLPGVTVRALRKGKKVASTRTDENGEYSLKLKRGRYTLRAKNRTLEISLKNKNLSGIDFFIWKSK